MVNTMSETVTLTGVDDWTDVDDLVQLHLAYDFLEFGVLVSRSRRGSPRYPSPEWIDRLLDAQPSCGLRLSAHLCGAWCRNIVEYGRADVFREWPSLLKFPRVQLNFGDLDDAETAHKGIVAADAQADDAGGHVEFIVQVHPVHRDKKNFLMRLCNLSSVSVSALFDASGGKGENPKEWPERMLAFRCGWAGGLGPHNLAAELPHIAAVSGPARHDWLDMESAVRSGDRFDVGKCREVCEIFKEWRKAR